MRHKVLHVRLHHIQKRPGFREGFPDVRFLTELQRCRCQISLIFLE